MAIATTEVKRQERGSEYADGGVRVLAAEPMNLRNTSARARLSGVLMRARMNGGNNWKWFNQLGEIHYAITRASKIAGYTKLKAVKFAPDGTIESEIENGLAADIVSGIYSRVGGTRGLIQRFFVQQKVPGESHLLRWRDGKTTDGYLFASSRELSDGRDQATGLDIEGSSSEGKLRLRTVPVAGHGQSVFERPIAQKDYLGRVWVPSNEWLDVPESPLNALDIQCDMLDTMTRSMSATMKSRFAVGGLLYFSNKVRDAVGNKHTTKPGTSVLEVIYNIMKENIQTAEDTDDILSILPILMMGEAEVGKVAEHITMDRQIFETDLKLRSELIDRILFGLDINAQSTKGNEDVSHWGSWNSSADELRLAVIPDVEDFCWTMDRLILRPQLLEAKETPEDIARVGVWYDLDEASVRANRQADAREIRSAGGLKMLTLLKTAGFKEADLLVGAEYIRWLGLTLRIPKLATFGTPEWDSIDWTDPALTPTKTGRIADSTTPAPAVGPGDDSGGPDDSNDDTPKKDKPV